MSGGTTLRLFVLAVGAVALLLAGGASGVPGHLSRAGSADDALPKNTDATPSTERTDPSPTMQPKPSRVATTRPASTETAPPDPHSGQLPLVGSSASEATPFECALDGAAFAECMDEAAATSETAGGFGTFGMDDDPTLSIDDVAVAESAADAVLTVTLSAGAATDVTVDYATTGGTATAAADFQTTTGTLTFDPGDISEAIHVPLVADQIDEDAEAFTVALSNPAGATVLDGEGAATIADDDPTPSLTISDVTVTEGDTGAVNAIFTVGLSNPSSSTVSVNYASAAGSATSPADFGAVSGTLNFTPGELTKTVPVAVQGDLVYEGNESFTLGLSGAVNATIADTTAVGTISENDPLPALSVNDVTVTEVNGGTVNAVFTVTITGARSLPASVSYATANGSATAGSDYTAVSDTHTFAVDETSKTVNVTVQGDNLHEADENFTLTLSSPSNAVLGDSSGVGTIANDDMAPRFSIDDVSVSEAAATAVFTVSRNRDSQLTVSVDAATANGSATAGSDYTTVATTTLTFVPGELSETVTVPLIGDALDEPNETFFVNLSNSVVATINDGQGVGTILDNDASPTLSIDDRTVAEGAEATFTVTLSDSSAQTITVNYAGVAGTATSPADFGGVSGTLSFAPGETSKAMPVSTVDDALDEDSETFTVALSSPANATLLDDLGLGTITDNDPEPSLSINDVAVVEGGGSATFTVTLSPISGRLVTVNYATAGGSATAGNDFTTTSGSLSFPAGQSTQQVTVPLTDDALDEPTEAFTVSLSAAVNASIADGIGTAMVTDNDAPPALSISNAGGSEGGGNVTFTVSLDAPSGLDVSVAYATANGSANAGSDYTTKSGGVTLAPGETSKTFTVILLDDALDEDNETFGVSLSGPVNATVADGQAVGTITDDDPPPSLTVNDVTVTEGNSGKTNATFTVTLSSASGRSIEVDYTTTAGGASAPADYDATSGRLTFAAGDTTKTVTVPVNGDSVNEGTETYFLDLSNAGNATIADARGVGTILDDDGAPSLAVNDATVVEGDSGSVAATFTVFLTSASGQTVSVGYSTANFSAIAPGDYTGTGGNLVFAPGQTAHTVTVDVNGDLLDESEETFRVNLSNAVNAAVADGTGVGTITDDDAPPALSVNDVSVAEGHTGTRNLTFTVTLSRASGLGITVDYTTADGTATAPADYTAVTGTLSFAAGEVSKQVTVAVKGDALSEANETFALNLANASNATFEDASGIGTITDDDSLPALSIGDAAVTEGIAGTSVNATFSVTLSAPSGTSISVDYSTADATAAAPADYTTTSGTLTFAAGQTSENVVVVVRGDALDEVNETFTLNLSGPTNATLLDGTGVGTITDDDAQPSLSVADVTVTEGNTTANASFTVSLGAASGRTVTVNYATANDTATSPADYTSSSGPISFSPGEMSKTVTVPVNGDLLDEIDEKFTVNLSGPDGAGVADAQGIATITDDDAPPSLRVDDVTEIESDTGSTVAANFTVSLNAPSGRTVTVAFATANNSAVSPADYQARTGSLTFAPGELSKQVTVLINGDVADEVTETYFLRLSSPANATISDAEGVGTIIDNETPGLSVTDADVAEGNTGTVAATFRVRLNVPSAKPITVDYATADGTASAPSDYASVSGKLAFAAGELEKEVTVLVNGDVVNEPTETFALNLANAVNARIADTSGTGTIMNDDAAAPPPPPPLPPPPPPPAPDTTPPGEVRNVRVKVGDETATISWAHPPDADFQGVSVRRIGAGKSIQNLAVYEGVGTTFTQRGLKNGSVYRYRIKTRDRAGNASAGVVVNALPTAALFAPLENAVVTAPPTLRWKAVRGATYYNVQLYRVGGSSQAKAITATKILSAWPKVTRFKLARTWRYGGKRYTLSPGTYRWYVWPGLQKRAASKYGPMLGDSSFTVKKKTVKKKRRR
jgi:Calx-beta domain